MRVVFRTPDVAIVLALMFASNTARGDETVEDRLGKLEEDLGQTKEQVKQLLPLTSRISGYIDFGFFHVGGNGSGIRPDLGNTIFPEYTTVIPGGTWVFMGDPLSTAINSRGEPADTDGSRAITFDPVHNGGKSSFIVNELNVGLFVGIGKDLVIQSMFGLVPRGRDVSD